MPATLHCFSPQDNINPPEMAQKIMLMCGAGSKSYVHGGGHVVAQDDAAVDAYSTFLFPQ